MIPRTYPQDIDWKQALRNAVTTPEALLGAVELPKSRWLSGAYAASRLFPLLVPQSYINRMEKSNPYDPLLRQVLPISEECEQHENYTRDPVGDHDACYQPGLIHKYKNRVLLITTGACAIHCRYCFRRHFPYDTSHIRGSNISSTLEYLKTHIELNEVILSGGDPLMLDDGVLHALLSDIASISHVRWIRIHSRLPVVLPERINQAFLAMIQAFSGKLIIVIHANHPNEIDDHVIHTFNTLSSLGIKLFNQSVLLKGINDNAQILSQLSKQLFSNHVQPYYIHLLDRTEGIAHFDLPESDAKSIYRDLQAELPGYLLPKLVREEPGKPSKTIV